MITPKLDSRTTADILAEIKRKSESHTPEWRFDPEDPDGGAALAQLFAEMFFDTIDRYNRFPDKCYLEFLNMLGVCAKSVSPAVGMAQANMVEGAAQSAYIKKGTRLFTDISDEDGDKRVYFETTSACYATPAQIKAVFMTDPAADVITRTDLSADNAFPLTLFSPNASENLECHCFGIAHADVLKLSTSAQIFVKITNSAMSFRNEQLISALCDPGFARWSYIGKNGKQQLSAQPRTDCIVLSKSSHEPLLLTDEHGEVSEEAELLPWIFCEMTKGASLELTADAIAISSVSVDAELQHGITPDCLFVNDSEMSAEKCGYCFGKEPTVYDSFYIACDEAFSKRKATVSVEFSLNTVVYQDKTLVDSNEPEFNSRLLVDKDDTQAAPYDNIYISGIAWEYWNGFGWARLEVSGDINPFSGDKPQSRKTISFICPDNFAGSMQNAHEGLWIRARITEIENRFSTRARRLLPLLKSICLRFDYGNDFLAADSVFVSNNCCDTTYAVGTTKTPMQLYRLMPEQHHAVYFLFDKPPEGYPVNLYMDFEGTTCAERVISFQRLTGDGNGRTSWSELKTTDRTEGFNHSGIVSLFCPKDFCEAELFGERGYWIRAVNRSMDFSHDYANLPRLLGLVKNAVDILQKQSVTDERHEIAAGRAGQSFTLSGKPIISCEVWIDELPETPLSELRELKSRDESAVRMVLGEDGQISECWVRWNARDTLAGCTAQERCYELRPDTAEIVFGNGINGRIPAYGSDPTISVNYSFGGGKAGNLPAGAVDGLIVSIPFIESMTNFRPTCGGSDGQSIDVIRKIGTKRLCHRGRAITAEDFESLVLEEFTEVCEVRCFSNRNSLEQQENGSVTVVVMPHDYTDEVYSASLCRRIYDYLSGCAGAGLVAGQRLSVIPAGVMTVSSEITVQIDDYEYAAEVEQNAVAAVARLISGSQHGGRIGHLPNTADVISALRRVEHISYVSGVMLIGEYFSAGRRITVPLDDGKKYRYYVAASGTHIIKL